MLTFLNEVTYVVVDDVDVAVVAVVDSTVTLSRDHTIKKYLTEVDVVVVVVVAAVNVFEILVVDVVVKGCCCSFDIVVAGVVQSRDNIIQLSHSSNSCCSCCCCCYNSCKNAFNFLARVPPWSRGYCVRLRFERS